MAVEHELDLVTIAEAAMLLKVSRITLHRWLKQGRLAAYHVGPRAVRIRRSDLAAVMTPIVRQEATRIEGVESVQTMIRPWTDAEIRQGLEALERSQAHIDAMLASRRGKPLDESWPIIREAREERSRQI